MARRGCFNDALANHEEPVKRRKSLGVGNHISSEVQRLREMPYAEYLQTPHWRRVRKLAFRHYGRLCADCGKRELLQVHHNTYERRGRERMKDLMVLCADCHAVMHDKPSNDVLDAVTREFRGMFGNTW